MFSVVQCASQHDLDLVFRQLIQNENAATRQERAGDFERRVFGSGSNEGNGAVFDGVQQCVLLCLVEAMDFVDEEYGAFTVTQFRFSLLDGDRKSTRLN